MPFRENESENPHVNYRHIPIRGLYELRRLNEEVRATLSEIQCSVLALQGDEDPVVDASSVEAISKDVESTLLRVQIVHANVHGILYQNVDNTHGRIVEFIDELDAKAMGAESVA